MMMMMMMMTMTMMMMMMTMMMAQEGASLDRQRPQDTPRHNVTRPGLRRRDAMAERIQ
jgi:hypothetical protein